MSFRGMLKVEGRSILIYNKKVISLCGCILPASPMLMKDSIALAGGLLGSLSKQDPGNVRQRFTFAPAQLTTGLANESEKGKDVGGSRRRVASVVW